MPRKAISGTEYKLKRGQEKSAGKATKGIKGYLPGGKESRRYEKRISEFLQPEATLDKAYRFAQEQVQPYYQEQRRQFQQEEAPEIIGQLGGGNRTSSALNQALSASLTNLNQRIQAQQNEIAMQYAQDALNRKWQAANALYSMPLQTLQGIQQQGMQAMQIPTYLPKSGTQSVGKQIAGHAINLAAEGAGTYFGGPVGGAAAGTAARLATTKLTGGTQTPSLPGSITDWLQQKGNPTTQVGEG